VTDTWFACVDTVVRFTWHFDDGDADAAVGLFAPDGLWQRNDGDVVGHQGLRRLLASRGDVLARHVLSNQRVDLSDAGGVRVESYVTAYRATGPSRPARLEQPLLVGRYRDLLVRAEGSWKIQRRSLRIDFHAA